MFKTKKTLLTALVGICSLHSAVAQSSGSSSKWHSSRSGAYYGQDYAGSDTLKISKKRMKQQASFIQHGTEFNAKPKNMWEIGGGAGLYNLFADVPTLFLWQKGGYGFHAHVRKAFGYVISSRLQYTYGIAKGLQWQESRNYRYNPAWNQNYNAAGNAEGVASQPLHYNYRMESHQLSFDVLAAANNIRFHKARTAFSVYGFVGISVNAYKTYVNTKNSDTAYDFRAIVGDQPQIDENRAQIKRDLQAGMDDSYETAAESEAGRRKMEFGKRGLGGVGKTVIVAPSFGAGMMFRISRNINFSIEDRITFPISEDLMDGQRWAEQVYGTPGQTQRRDVINYLGAGFNFNIGGRKKVEPLYWVNPMIYPYSQLDTSSHLLMPELFLVDADDDGIADQLDQCPNTPKGVPVDAHGCPLDTDGDTVPDYMDWQLITPTECQPSDEKGIGKCPCPDCYPPAPVGCDNILPGELAFGQGNSSLSTECKRQLDVLATQLKGQPHCKVLIKTFPKPGYKGQPSQKIAQDRLTNVSEYLQTEGGISSDRIRWKYDEYMSKDKQAVEYHVPMFETQGWPVYVSPRNGDEN